MDTYTILRQFADSWGLLGMFLVFLWVVLRVLFLPGLKAAHDNAAGITLRASDDLQEHLKKLETTKEEARR